jgi:hypothetical protein
MGFFSFIENFFFISLGIVFILVLLLVYHFKQRMSSVERKGDTMYELVVNMVKEIRFLKAFSSVKEEDKREEPERNPISVPSKLVPEPISYTVTEKVGKILVSDDSDSDSGSDIESGYSDSDSDSDSEENTLKNIGVEDVQLDLDEIMVESSNEIPNSAESVELVQIKELVQIELGPEVLDTENEVLDTEEEVLGTENEVLGTEEEVVQESSEDEATPIYTIEHLRKMNINQLKSIAISSGISGDTSKMKKNELIALLQKRE